MKGACATQVDAYAVMMICSDSAYVVAKQSKHLGSLLVFVGQDAMSAIFPLGFVGQDAMSALLLLASVDQDAMSVIFLPFFISQDAQSPPRFILRRLSKVFLIGF